MRGMGARRIGALAVPDFRREVRAASLAAQAEAEPEPSAPPAPGGAAANGERIMALVEEPGHVRERGLRRRRAMRVLGATATLAQVLRCVHVT
jgi:hypothetical protein